MQQLLDDLDRAHSKVKEARGDTIARIDSLASDLAAAKANIQREVQKTFNILQIDIGDETKAQMAVAAQMNTLPKKGQDVLKRIVNINKQYYEHLSKYGKALGKEFESKPEYEEAMFPEVFVLDKPTLNKALVEHMHRSGFF